MPNRHAVSFIEVLIAVAIIAVLGVTVQSSMVSTLQGIGVDRVSETKRHLVLDLLERFSHPYSDLEALFETGGKGVAPGVAVTRVLTLDEAITLVAIPPEQAAVTKAVLESGSVTGFTVVWTKGVEVGKGDADQALRLDQIWLFPVQSKALRGALVSSFRMFYARGK